MAQRRRATVVVLSTSVDARDLSPLGRVYLTADSIKTGAAAGLKYFAMASPPESLADGSAANFYAPLKAFHAGVFDNLSTARAWLLSMPAKG